MQHQPYSMLRLGVEVRISVVVTDVETAREVPNGVPPADAREREMIAAAGDRKIVRDERRHVITVDCIGASGGEGEPAGGGGRPRTGSLGEARGVGGGGDP